jgi:phytoene dehydrogenase-like protein
MSSGEECYDAIVIGSGIGGLTAAAILSKVNRMRVLVLERHWVAGGQTHEFRRKQYSWDVGLHYVGEMAPGSRARQIFDFISDGKVTWQKMPADFDYFVYPDFTFAVPDNETEYVRRLIEQFPQEAKAIEDYFRDLKRAASWLGQNFAKNLLPAVLRPVLRGISLFSQKKALSTTKEVLERHFSDSRLKALLVSQWGDYGLPPAMSSFAIHALIATHYFRGGYYPAGGGESIAKAILPVIEKNGGRCLINHEVTRILVQNGRAVGVQVLGGRGKRQEKKEYYASDTVSNVGAVLTFGHLLPNEACIPARKELKHHSKGLSAVGLYLGLNESPARLGFKGENYWIYSGYDHDQVAASTPSLLEGNCRFAYLSFPSLKDPKAQVHTAEILSFADYEYFKDWKVRPWKNRGKAYAQLKEQIAEGMLRLVERHFPKFRTLIDYKELSTPLTMEHFTGRREGLMYGVPATPDRFQLTCLEPKTSIPNLYLSGSDVCSLGIVGAMMGGVAAAALVNGSFGFIKIMSQIQREARGIKG